MKSSSNFTSTPRITLNMKLQKLNTQVTHIQSDQFVIAREQDAVDLMGETDFQDIILHDHNFNPAFFDLSTKILGDVLQKLTTYKVRLAIIGNFEKYPSKVLADFIRESNRGKKYLFVSSLDEVRRIWKL